MTLTPAAQVLLLMLGVVALGVLVGLLGFGLQWPLPRTPDDQQ